MGAVFLAVGVLLLVFGPSTKLGASTNFVGVVVFLIVLGGAILVISFLSASRVVLAASLDRDGLELTMSRPPNWSIRWAEPGGWIDLVRGYRKGSPEETRSHGWVFMAPHFETTIEFDLGRAIASRVAARGWRVSDQRSGAAERRREFEYLSLDHPLNPERHKPPFSGRSRGAS